ncbi:hypothetical protein [Thalassotalea maritima]|uniref:hypothetical protein n=1 Tax=Thalassotalea maritima TaxID=3242416 RepID=UPI00352965C5
MIKQLITLHRRYRIIAGYSLLMAPLVVWASPATDVTDNALQQPVTISSTETKQNDTLHNNDGQQESVGEETDWTDDTWQDDGWGDDSWQGDNWGDDTNTSNWQVSGFVEAGYGQFTQTNVTASQQSLAEIRAQLDSSYRHQWFTFNAKADVFIDDVTRESDYDLRLFNVAIHALENTDVIIGRQVITWGTGDYLFLNDLFAKDWQSFFSGRDDAYLKAPNDAIRLLHYVGDTTIDVAYSPKFTADNYISGERFSFYSPLQQAVVAPEQFNVLRSDDEQYALRIATTINGIEYGVYGYKGPWTTPVGAQITEAGVSNYFPKLRSYGASVRAPALAGLVNAEFAVYNSVDDSQGVNPLLPNDQVRLLVGYERELISNLTGAMQFYVEHTQDHQALQASAIEPDQVVSQNRQLVTLRLTHQAMQQKLTSSLFVFYSPSDDDAYLKPTLNYRYDDNWLFAAGANLFVGKDLYTFFGQHQDNTNVWVRVRYRY